MCQNLMRVGPPTAPPGDRRLSLAGFHAGCLVSLTAATTRRWRPGSRLRECRRVVKPGGHVTVLFGNSSGAMWQLLQRAVAAAGFEVVPDMIAVLDKGQRSVKGLASGFENVATLDLMLTRIEQGWDLSRLDLRSVTEQLRAAELDIGGVPSPV